MLKFELGIWASVLDEKLLWAALLANNIVIQPLSQYYSPPFIIPMKVEATLQELQFELVSEKITKKNYFSL